MRIYIREENRVPKGTIKLYQPSMKNKEDKVLNLTEKQAIELLGVIEDPIYFSEFVKVIHPIKGKVPFDLYPYQKRVLIAFMQHRFNIIKKFRQGGLTELICLFCLWLASYHINKNILILSIKDRVAKKVLRRIKYMYKNLPKHLQTPVVNGRGADIGTASELEFINGSVITSIPTTEDAGRSEPASLVVIDEAAIIRMAGKIWAALAPTLSTGGAGILNSTPYGVGNFYHETWVEACSGTNGFNAINLKYYMHPDYDEKWYAQMKAMLGPRRTSQEVDGDFLSSGNTVFDLLDIRELEDRLDDHPVIPQASLPASFRKLRNYKGALRIYLLPKPNEQYFLGADISTGRSRDYTTFSVVNKEGIQYASFRAKIPIDETTKLLFRVGTIYNNALLAPESNDIGLGVASGLQALKYPNLYYSRRLLKEKGQSKPTIDKIPGWYTTSKNRPVIIAELETDVRENSITIKNPFFCQEAYTFIFDDQNRPVAMGKNSRNSGGSEDTEVFTDDSIFAEAIANHIRKMLKNTTVVLPQ